MRAAETVLLSEMGECRCDPGIPTGMAQGPLVGQAIDVAIPGTGPAPCSK
jgi:hypothetical protein